MIVSRVLGVILALALFAGATVFFLLRSSFTAETVYRARTAVGLEAAVPEHHIVASDFRGWAVVRYAVADAPALAEADGNVVLEYPPDGRLQTSTPADDATGFLHREYLRRGDDGLAPLSRMGEIWGEFNMRMLEDGDNRMGVQRYSGFFVGTRAEYRAAEPATEVLRKLGHPEIRERSVAAPHPPR